MLDLRVDEVVFDSMKNFVVLLGESAEEIALLEEVAGFESDFRVVIIVGGLFDGEDWGSE